MNFQIYTMYVNRSDLLVQALTSIPRFMDKVVILDNSPHQDLALQEFPGQIYRPVVPLFVAQAYNVILDLAVERAQDIFFMMHSDAVASDQAIQALLAKAVDLFAQQVPWGVIMTNYDVLCLWNTRAIKQMRWDYYLPLYYTDVDFFRRMNLAGIQIIQTGIPVEHSHGGSSSLKSDLALRWFVQTNYSAWREYYIAKWGGDRDEESYVTPFNLPIANDQ